MSNLSIIIINLLICTREQSQHYAKYSGENSVIRDEVPAFSVTLYGSSVVRLTVTSLYQCFAA